MGEIIMSNKLDVSEQQFERLTAIKSTNKRYWNQVVWLCRCSCGNLTEVPIRSLVTGNTRSCGCLGDESRNMAGKNKTHGETQKRLFRTWQNMKTRCSNPNASGYKYYGGKGISIYKDWLEYAPFRFWAILNGYQDNLTIDRIDNNGNYEPGNCQFISQSENTKKSNEERKRANV